MANLKTPTARIIASASDSKNVTDAVGRVITVRKLDALDKMELFSLIGADNSKNEQYLQYALAAFSVTQIDSVPAGTPTNLLALKGMVKKLGDEGIGAVLSAYVELMTAGNPEKTEADVKN